ncbi:MAG: type II toxin-antitoxin system VapB family antitoxin [Rickettsiales bacterium]
MRTTINFNDKLVDKAQKLTGIKEKSTLVNEAISALIARESARRLALLGGSEHQVKPVKRRKSK